MSTLHSFEERKALLIKKFSAFPSWEDRFRLVVDYGKKLNSFSQDQKLEESLVPGCLSKVWVVGKFENGVMIYQADADSAIVKGLVGILVYLYSGLIPDEILNVSPEFLRDLGLEQAVSTNRRNGLWHMLEKIQKLAKNAKGIES